MSLQKVENDMLTRQTMIHGFKRTLITKELVKVGPPVHSYEHEAGSYGDGFT